MEDKNVIEGIAPAGADISMFHAPDLKWKNAYYEDERQNVLFLLPSKLIHGVIAVDLDWARSAVFVTHDGVGHRFRDCKWSVSSDRRKTGYPKTTVNDRSAKCGKRTVLLGTIAAERPPMVGDAVSRLGVGYKNGDTFDNRRCNLMYGPIKANNDMKYAAAPKVVYPCPVWWK